LSPRPAFSVVVPAFDAEDRIAATIGSVLEQTDRDFELIVVDDGSADATLTLAREAAAADSRITVLTQPNAGTVAARTLGVESSSGRWLAFLDDDDLWLPGFLAAARGRFESDPALGIVAADAWVLDTVSGRVGARTAAARFAWPLRRLPAAIGADAAEAALLRVNFLTTCATAVTSEAYGRAGGLDAAVRGTDDWDLWLRIVADGYALGRLPEPLAVLRKRPTSAGSDAAMMARNALLVLERARRRGTRTRHADRIAARHARLIELELRSMERAGGRGPLLRLSGAARRIGRKRLPAIGAGPEPQLPQAAVRLLAR